MLFFGYAHWMSEKYAAERRKSQMLESTVNDMEEAVNTYSIRLNDTVRYYAAAMEDLSMTKGNVERKYGELLAAAAIKAKDADRLTDVALVAVDTIRIPVMVDSFGGVKASYSDAYAAISVSIGSDRMADIDYSIRDSIVVVNTQKRHSLFFGLIKWKETMRTTVMSKNPNSMIVGLRSINVMEQ